jgi:hypothetical protein
VTTREWLISGDNAKNMGRFAFLIDLDDKVAGRAIWETVASMFQNATLTDSPIQFDAWTNFVDGWNSVKADFQAGRL